MLTVPPKPPRPCSGQRNASIAAPNPASPNPIAVSRPRLRNWRRLTPISSSSTGSYSATSPPRRRASMPPNDEARVSSERSRPVASRSVDEVVATSVDVDVELVASSSRLRVSRDNAPVAARARPASITTETAATNKMTMMTIGTSTE